MSKSALALRQKGELSIAAADLVLCQQHIARHSKSFYLSSLLLPKHVRYEAWALYAFCRQADDAVDGENPGDGTVPKQAPEQAAQLQAVARLREKLAAVYQKAPGEGPHHAIDRAFFAVVERTHMPRELPSRVLDGMEQDAIGQTYPTWETLYSYCFNVASTVGLMMTCVMGHIAPPEQKGEVLLRASDLGVAMQLTNIARDVGEDARRGRVYLPEELLRKHGLSSAQVLSQAAGRESASPSLRAVVKELLSVADRHYEAAERGIFLLPTSVRWAIRSASRVYQRIGQKVAAQGYDTLNRRARVSLFHKLWLLSCAYVSGLISVGKKATDTFHTGPKDALLSQYVKEVRLLP
ncbi:MAG TPA: phytoene/squalene synthase family protein [Pseudomonadota bacterium]|nr:phytoene/squalene synthase family protein [Pseudomonadota bacterium]